MLTIVMGSHMGSLTTPTIGSTFPQSSRFDFSFEIVHIRWRTEALNTLQRRQRFIFHILSGFTFSCNSSCILLSSVTWYTLGMKELYKFYMRFSFCSPLIFANCVCFFEAMGTEQVCECYCSDWSSLEFHLNLN